MPKGTFKFARKSLFGELTEAVNHNAPFIQHRQAWSTQKAEAAEDGY